MLAEATRKLIEAGNRAYVDLAIRGLTQKAVLEVAITAAREALEAEERRVGECKHGRKVRLYPEGEEFCRYEDDFCRDCGTALTGGEK
jgi:hypothetical protein